MSNLYPFMRRSSWMGWSEFVMQHMAESITARIGRKSSEHETCTVRHSCSYSRVRDEWLHIYIFSPFLNYGLINKLWQMRFGLRFSEEWNHHPAHIIDQYGGNCFPCSHIWQGFAAGFSLGGGDGLDLPSVWLCIKDPRKLQLFRRILLPMLPSLLCVSYRNAY